MLEGTDPNKTFLERFKDGKKARLAAKNGIVGKDY
jgi:hypothetical protein